MTGADSMAAGNGPSTIPCLVCKRPLTVRLAHGRKFGKPFVMLVCGRDGRHFRAFISDRQYVTDLLDRAEASS